MAICLLQSGGMVLVFLVQQYHARQDMAQKLHSEHTRFSRLSLSKSEYGAGRISQDEIFLRGKMYDVKSVAVSGNKVELLVINDTNEENIIGKMEQLFTNSGRQSCPLPDNLVKLLTLDYICPAPFVPHLVPPGEFRQPQLFILPGSDRIISFIGKMPSPPPRTV